MLVKPYLVSLRRNRKLKCKGETWSIKYIYGIYVKEKATFVMESFIGLTADQII